MKMQIIFLFPSYTNIKIVDLNKIAVFKFCNYFVDKTIGISIFLK